MAGSVWDSLVTTPPDRQPRVALASTTLLLGGDPDVRRGLQMPGRTAPTASARGPAGTPRRGPPRRASAAARPARRALSVSQRDRCRAGHGTGRRAPRPDRGAGAGGWHTDTAHRAAAVWTLPYAAASAAGWLAGLAYLSTVRRLVGTAAGRPGQARPPAAARIGGPVRR